jgi:hypothetical protein
VSVDAWTQALLVTPLTIGGVRLRPFSLAHSMVLRAKASPYIIGGPATHDDLFFALQVCARTLAQIRESLLGPHPPFGRLLIAGLRWRRASFSLADKSFRTYLSDYRRFPERQPSDSKGFSAAPFEWHAARILCGQYGVTLAEAWDMPLGLAVCAFDTWTESQGDKGLVTAYDQALTDLLKIQAEADAAGDTAQSAAIQSQIIELVKTHGGE